MAELDWNEVDRCLDPKSFSGRVFTFLNCEASVGQLHTATLAIARRMGLLNLEDLETNILEMHEADEETCRRSLRKLYRRLLQHWERGFDDGPR